MRTTNEKRISSCLAFGLAGITILVYTHKVSDPVNSPKLLLLGIVAFSSASILLIPNIKYLRRNFRIVTISSLLMFASMIFSAIQSNSPFSQNWYGVQGRNTGILAHLAFILLTLSILGLKEKKSFEKIIYGFLFAGLVNILYCLWVLLFGDFIGWNNQYQSLLGTFGNPNFISSFLGIVFGILCAYLIVVKRSLKEYLVVIVLMALTVYEIIETNSIQGLLLVAIGLYINVFFFLRNQFKKTILTNLHLIVGFIIGSLGIFGILGKGPFASIIYQETFEFRKQYWLAGIKMGANFPLQGVGIDSYGDWYRQMRSPAAAIAPGLGVVTNVAHNVYIDAFANGGFLLLFTYLVPPILALVSAIKVINKVKELDFIFIALVSGWTTYQIQSLISISQIGLSIWGWVFSAMLIAYPKVFVEKSIHDESSKLKRARSSETQSILFAPVILASMSLAITLYSPPLLADNKWTSAYLEKDAEKLYESLNPGFFNPNNSFMLAQGIQIFESNKFPEKAHALALIATRFNSRNFDAWQLLYYSSNSSPQERALAKSKMIELDPLNDEWKNL